MNFPKEVRIGDITIRDGFQHEERFVSTDAKTYYAEQLILAGVKRIELTNLVIVIAPPRALTKESQR